MKNQIWKRALYAALILLAVGVTGFFAWWLSYQEQKGEVHNVSEPTAPRKGVEPTLGVEPTRGLRPLITPVQAKKMDPSVHPTVTMFKSLFTEEQLADPEVQRLVKILESPEYLAFIETKPNTAEFDAFLAACGFHNDPERFTKHFREQFPTGEPADFEPEMREKLTQMFAGLSEDEKHPLAGHFTKLITEFLGNARNHAWVAGQFQGDGFGKWVSDVIYGSRSDVPTEIAQPESLPIDADNVDMFDIAPQEYISEEDVETLSDVDILPDADKTDGLDESGTPPNIDIEAELERQLLTEIPELPTEEHFEESIEKVLRDRFNPDRFHQAMETLNRYGPKEGIRRLQESDPEIAAHVERLLQKRNRPNRMENSNED